MFRGRLAPCLVLAASAAGCGALLGVEEVTLDDGSGGGGLGGRGDASGDGEGDEDGGGARYPGPTVTAGGGAPSPDGSASTAGTGAGDGGAPGAGGGPTTTSSSTTSAGTTSGGGDPAGATSSSASGGGACVQDRPACPGIVPSRFEEESALDGWLVESPRVKLSGKKLQLDPEEDGVAASVRSVAPVAPSASCAVWVRREDGDDGSTRLSLLGADGGERLAIAWSASGALAHADGIEVGSVSASDGAARLLRIRLEAEGAHLEIRSADTTCWEPVAGPITVAPFEGPVRLSYVGDGKAKLDDYGVP